MCGHAQAISGVFSVASHSALQYLPDVVTHEQSGCAHFSAFSEATFFPSTSDQERMIQVQMLISRKECFCTKKNTLRIVVRTVAARGQVCPPSLAEHVSGDLRADFFKLQRSFDLRERIMMMRLLSRSNSSGWHLNNSFPRSCRALRRFETHVNLPGPWLATGWAATCVSCRALLSRNKTRNPGSHRT